MESLEAEFHGRVSGLVIFAVASVLGCDSLRGNGRDNARRNSEFKT